MHDPASLQSLERSLDLIRVGKGQRKLLLPCRLDPQLRWPALSPGWLIPILFHALASVLWTRIHKRPDRLVTAKKRIHLQHLWHLRDLKWQRLPGNGGRRQHFVWALLRSSNGPRLHVPSASIQFRAHVIISHGA